ncbi:MAG: sulfatase-like hydrolase/transferase [Prolixibacteraceae bacterium]|nr:sulfatase-like hydrolase/transferase [Prolixibacteraceae bacterium]MBN2649563.1 sulfatase-like hydrolase/transferase [Prolixibacteraceae bacterium]
MVRYITYLLKSALFWIILFAFYRLAFIVFNLPYAADTTTFTLMKSFWVGLRLDLSITGYILFLTGFISLVSVLIFRKYYINLLLWVNGFFMLVFSALLMGNINLYSYWGRPLDAEGLSFLKTPWVIFESISWGEALLFAILFAGLTWFAIYLYKKLIKNERESIPRFSIARAALSFLLILFINAVLIIPIRGGIGIAPLNTGAAYFSSSNYANHAALNPLWNLSYSFKRIDATSHHYKFMDDTEALSIFNETKKSSSQLTPQLLKTNRPNIVVILLESFSSQVVGCLGGKAVTPNLDSIAAHGILFNNIYAASDRSDKGLVATLAGYQVMPAYSIIQYPTRAQHLTFLPKTLKSAGYNQLSFLYGGDIGFKGMNSFVTMAGFEEVITMDDFPASTRGEKWGTHDEYTFERLFEEMQQDANSNIPFFHFFFTLSSHEPFDVPMDKVIDDPYLNSIYYTDQCLGNFYKKLKASEMWDNTLVIMLADHGTAGPLKATSQMRERYQIPMAWFGGALNVSDTTITTIGSQKDLAATLLSQLEIPTSGFMFSKDIMANSSYEYAFFTYHDAYGLVTPHSYHVYDNNAQKYIVYEGEVSKTDSLFGRAYLQTLSANHLSLINRQ